MMICQNAVLGAACQANETDLAMYISPQTWHGALAHASQLSSASANELQLFFLHTMHYRDESDGKDATLPRGLYWGVYLGDERKGAWKIDIWATGPEGLERVQTYCDAIMERLTEPRRVTILNIKSACWRHPEYRRAFSGEDIYTAVLHHGIRSVDEFWNYLERENGV